MEEESKAKTALICHCGLFQYCRMQFGLTNVLATFQRSLDKLFAGWNFVFIYLDDILVALKTFSEHVGHVKRVLQEVGLNVKPSKCTFTGKD